MVPFLVRIKNDGRAHCFDRFSPRSTSSTTLTKKWLRAPRIPWNTTTITTKPLPSPCTPFLGERPLCPSRTTAPFPFSHTRPITSLGTRTVPVILILHPIHPALHSRHPIQIWIRPKHVPKSPSNDRRRMITSPFRRFRLSVVTVKSNTAFVSFI
jgi:hypothetical protein